MRMRRPAAEIEPVSWMPSRRSALPGPKSMPGAKRIRSLTACARSFAFMRALAMSIRKSHSRASRRSRQLQESETMSHRGMFRALIAASVAFVASVLPLHASADDVLVFAAASLKPALDEIIATPEAKAIGEIKASYAASSQLAKQIEAGA